MKVYYALYDQSYDNNAQYWTWFPEELTQQMRDSIASKSGAFQMRPKHPNQLEPPDIVGGIINYQNEWCVVYRFFNGGNDPQGRPDRCVLATAWVKTEEAKDQNIYSLLTCPVFLKIQSLALNQCPISQPPALVENYSNPIRQNDPQFKLYRSNSNIENWSYQKPEEIEFVGKLFPYLIADGLESLQVLQSSAYMETFSGTPLASGVTYIPQKVEQPESEPEQEQARKYGIPLRFKVYAAIILFLLFAHVAVFTAKTAFRINWPEPLHSIILRIFDYLDNQNEQPQQPDDSTPPTGNNDSGYYESEPQSERIGSSISNTSALQNANNQERRPAEIEPDTNELAVPNNVPKEAFPLPENNSINPPYLRFDREPSQDPFLRLENLLRQPNSTRTNPIDPANDQSGSIKKPLEYKNHYYE